MQPQQQDTLYQMYDRSLNKITGDTQSNNIMNMINADPQANNSVMVNIPADLLGSGQSTGIQNMTNGGIMSGKQKYTDDAIPGFFFAIDTDGVARLNIGNGSSFLKWTGTAVVIEGGISASSISIPDNVTNHSFHVDSSGNTWWGATTLGASVGSVLNTGVASFSNITITGGSVNGTVITNASISGPQLVNGTITATQIASATITTTQIANATITGTNIASATITGGNIAATTITGTNIANGTITATQIGSATITGSNIASGTITGTNIGATTITASNIANATITGTQIAATTITAGNIANATITGTQIAGTTITSGNIANATITSSQISATAGITGGQIASATITGGNIASTTITAGNITNLTITAAQIANLTITSAKTQTGLMSYSHNIVFTSTSATQVNWASGSLTTSDGTTYSISAGNTGTMSAQTFIYLDKSVSITVLQITTTYSTAVGDSKMLVGIAQNNTNESVFQIFNGVGGLNLAGANIVAGSITANEIAATTITAAKIVSGTITATQIAANTITASQIAANTITASQIASATITGTQIAATTITASNMNVSTLSAITANLGTITAGSINLNSGMASIDVNGNAIFKSLAVSAYKDYADASVVYTGTWTTVNNSVRFHNGDKTSSTVGDYFVITFTATQIGLVLDADGVNGKVDIYLDGVFQSTLDCYNFVTARSITYTLAGLSNTTHTVKGIVATKNPSSGGNAIVFEGYTTLPSNGITAENLSLSLWAASVNKTTDANGYAKGTPTPPTGYYAVAIVGVSLTEAVMSDATQTDPKLCVYFGYYYLYNGAPNTTYTITYTFLLSSNV